MTAAGMPPTREALAALAALRPAGQLEEAVLRRG